MATALSETGKKSLLTGLYKRVKNRVRTLGKKKRSLLSEIGKKSDSNKIHKLREEILNL